MDHVDPAEGAAFRLYLPSAVVKVYELGFLRRQLGNNLGCDPDAIHSIVGGDRKSVQIFGAKS